MSGERRRLLHRERMARYRARQRDDLIVVDLVAPEIDLIEFLRAEGFLDTPDPSRAELSAAVSKWFYQTCMHHREQTWGPP